MSISEKCADFIVKYREKISRVFWGLLGISLILCLFVQVNISRSPPLLSREFRRWRTASAIPERQESC